jgi:hypothetical protein
VVGVGLKIHGLLAGGGARKKTLWKGAQASNVVILSTAFHILFTKKKEAKKKNKDNKTIKRPMTFSVTFSNELTRTGRHFIVKKPLGFNIGMNRAVVVREVLELIVGLGGRFIQLKMLGKMAVIHRQIAPILGHAEFARSIDFL